MKVSLKYIIVFFFHCIIGISISNGQDSFRDSIERILDTKIADTLRARLYIDLAEYILEEEEWVPYNRKALNLANEQLKKARGQERKFYLRIKANATGNLGYYFDDHGDLEKSLGYYFESMELYDQAGDLAGKAAILGNLGIIYTDQGNLEEALDYLEQALEIKLNTAPSEVAKNYLNLGVVYEQNGEDQKALEYYQKGYDAALKVNNNIDIATGLNNIGSWYHKKKQYNKAKPYLKSAIHHCQLENDDAGAAWAMANLGSCYSMQGRPDSAFVYLYDAKTIADQFDYPELKQAVYEKLYTNYLLVGDYRKAHESYLVSEKMKDRLNNVETQKKAIKEKMRYDHNLETATLKLKREEEQKREEQLRYFILGVLFLVLIFGVFIYSRLRITRKQKALIEIQKAEVETQKDIIEEKNKEIVDSINYAKRLQQAILPSLDSFNVFSDFFLLYLPKDIVAGDFYWYHETTDYQYIAVADCTGHGVPGAMVSVVCANALERVVNEKKAIEPGELLNEVTIQVIDKFDNEQGDVKDGMDVGLIRIEKSSNKLLFAGAFNPCWIIRNQEVIELKANRRPVGRHINDEKFLTQMFDLEAGDWVYLMTDGYQDQFGGENEKKYKSGALKTLLVNNSVKSGDGQKIELMNSFDTWKGNLMQLDDVCLLGIKI